MFPFLRNNIPHLCVGCSTCGAMWYTSICSLSPQPFISPFHSWQKPKKQSTRRDANKERFPFEVQQRNWLQPRDTGTLITILYFKSSIPKENTIYIPIHPYFPLNAPKGKKKHYEAALHSAALRPSDGDLRARHGARGAGSFAAEAQRAPRTVSAEGSEMGWDVYWWCYELICFCSEGVVVSLVLVRSVWF